MELSFAARGRMSYPVFCLICGSNFCLHLQEACKRKCNRMNAQPVSLSRRDVDILRALADPRWLGGKDVAHALGLSLGSLKVYQKRICRKLGWNGGNTLRLALWAVAHSAQLEITLPTAADFQRLPD